MEEGVTDCQNWSLVKSDGWSPLQKKLAITFDLGVAAWQEAKNTLKYRCAVSVTNSMEMWQMHFEPAAVFGPYAMCLILYQVRFG